MASISNNPVYFCYQSLLLMLDWLYPPVCAGCKGPGQRWCPSCQINTKQVGLQVCDQCGEPNSAAGKCLFCRQAPPAYNALRSWAVYGGPIRHALHSLKYRQNIALGDSLSIHLIQFYKELNWSIDIIMPVPLSRKRKRSRGYNQAALLARPISLATGIPYGSHLLERVRETASQVGLSDKDRSQNVKGAFKAKSGSVRGKNILIVDDITTTGATIQNCAAALLEAGAAQIYGLTVARALLETHNDSEISYAPNT
jgi:competence protein ComFC